MIYDSLSTKVNYFKELLEKQIFTQQEIRELCKRLEFMELKKRDVVFEAGNIGRHFHIILKGEVFILLKKAGLERGNSEK